MFLVVSKMVSLFFGKSVIKFKQALFEVIILCHIERGLVCTAGDLSVLFPLLVPLSFSLGTTASCGVDLKFVFCERSGFHKAAKFVFSHPRPGVSNFDAV